VNPEKILTGGGAKIQSKHVHAGILAVFLIPKRLNQMKHYLWLPLFLIFSTSNALAFHSENVEIFEQFDDLKMIAYINKKDILNNPEWNPNDSSPPLTIAEAIDAIKKFNKSSDLPRPLKEVELRLFPNQTKFWHYLIKVENNTAKTKYDVYVVLMNGKVIPAIIKPKKAG